MAFDADVVQAFRPAQHGGPEGPHYTYSVFRFGVVQAFRPARHGGPEGPHYIETENALKGKRASGRALRGSGGEARAARRVSAGARSAPSCWARSAFLPCSPT